VKSQGGLRSTRVAVTVAVAVALLVPLVAAATSRRDGRVSAQAAVPSFARDVAPILRQKCTGCHQVGGIAPFPLQTARQAHRRASLIAAAVGANIMPPWPPGRDSPAYAGQEKRQLTAQQRATLLRWARAGGPASGPGVGKPPPVAADVRQGERVIDLKMASTYRPTSRNGATDDYRCFLLDPKLTEDVFVTGVRIVPGATALVHHVILFRIDPSAAPDARRLDAGSAGPGWSCFGGIGMTQGGSQSLDGASWISAWAPGWGAGRLPDGTGVPMTKGTMVVMQVHYNLLNGHQPDRSHAVLTVTPSTAGLAPMETTLLPAPVELACVKGEKGRLCNRDAALADLGRKYGSFAAFAPAGLLTLCGQNAADPQPSTTSRCSRKIEQPETIFVVAGHMHLLGKSIRIELDPGTPKARVLLDIPRWDFHWQNAYTLEQPVEVKPGDVVRVTCRYDPARRLRGDDGIPKTPRYVLWGEGTADEMCLGLLQVTHG
jgi:hypothetical protein